MLIKNVNFKKLEGLEIGENMKRVDRLIINIAEECLALGKEERPEIEWLNQVYDRFRKEKGSLGKSEADKLLYTRMYDSVPEKPSDTLKIRYWRTGRHLPASREQCLSFGKALDLSKEELRYLIQGYYDRSDQVFEAGQEDALYIERKNCMNELVQEYLDKVHPLTKQQLYRSGSDLKHSLRHLYFTDAKGYITLPPMQQTRVEPHIVSINYESEFSRQIKLVGEIPRRAMIRHLLVFGIPFINRELLSERLEYFGYLPLEDTHTMTDGSRLDKLILDFLKLYETSCAGEEPEECILWFRRAYSILDRYLEKMKNKSLRFFYFKALKGIIG